MQIIPQRTMRLGGQRVERGTPVDVPAADAELALRHGWAVQAPESDALPEASAAGGLRVVGEDGWEVEAALNAANAAGADAATGQGE